MADIKQSIIASVFSRRNATGNLEETYVSHVKIWEEAGTEGRKARYILLSQASNGSGFIHKSKLNNNGSFSVGKTWRLVELRGLQVIAPIAFNISLSRTYRWQTESPVDQSNFLIALIRLFRQITGGATQLNLEGVADPDGAEGLLTGILAPYQAPSTVPAIDNGRSQRNLRPSTPQNEPIPSVPSPHTNRNGIPLPRAASPTNASRELSSSVRSKETLKPPSSFNGPRQRKDSDGSYGSFPLPRRRTSMAPQQQQPVPVINLPTPGGTPKPHDVDVEGDGLNMNAGQSRKESHQSGIARPQTGGSTNGSSGGALVPTGRPRNASPEPSALRSRKPSGTKENLNGHASRKDHNARMSYFDPPNQQSLDRLTNGAGDGGVNGHMDADAGDEAESAQDTLASVEEMIEGYEWASDDVIGRKMARGAADMIEARLLDELMALEKANIHSFLESDDRIGLVMKFMDDALAELDNLDGQVSSYKIHLNAVNDDISYIQSQNRGLQVQTQNQRTLLNEIQNLLQTVQVDTDALMTLTQESLEKSQSITRLEQAAAELYKALQAGRDTDMAATMERLQEYRTHNSQFCKRMYDFLSIMFTAQSKLLMGETSGLAKPGKGGKSIIIPHHDIEEYLGRYCGLILYLKEMDEPIYGRLCAAYFSAASDLHSTQIKALLNAYLGYVKRASEDEGDHVFGSTPATPGKAPSGMRRAGTLIRSPIESRNRDKDKPNNATSSSLNASSSGDGDLRVAEVFALTLDQIIPLIYQEGVFMADFLQINVLNHDSALTFADYMGLDHYFRRQATRSNSLSSTTVKLVRGAMELIFGFLPTEIKAWLEKALERDPIEIVGVLATLEKSMMDADDKGNQFLVGFLNKQHTRLKGVFDRHINDQLKSIEQTKLTTKKRKGVVPFIKHFPGYIHRVEDQLIIGAGESGLEVRGSVDAAYDKIVNAMFENLKAVAKMDGDEEDKGQLNYHVVIIENMHYFISEMAKIEVGSVGSFTKKARVLYDENLNAYVRMIFRRPFGKIIDYFEGLERLLRTLSSPTDIITNPTYSKNALRKLGREYTIKDIRKHIDALYKIVQKHFIDSQDRDRVAAVEESVGKTVLLGVWRTCEEELVRLAEGWKERVGQCYGESAGAGLEFGVGDVENAFRKHRTGT
ncbi:hypothetical protein P691DRAFT_670723 [Macrolepiota fuliginosa MF-IS2]|uniref:Exocyst complex component Sec3 PIP2-binding N-terminal domain-containing protein n=1 Tax=Macrolepiota fuliginosa MF-IS2 TaxID=1400762 RepID=A0A9P5XDG3_9AGAR|nr:hypothetical protein P691DRAFT_670723 [Macrolepiota fuliginosa MF-IS2]